ncbi:MAG TPA: cytochrome c peroxidase [Kofleriaceae bacterium]|nr:cytochrome c peroxidase [Kofleriaceae bacterium]
MKWLSLALVTVAALAGCTKKKEEAPAGGGSAGSAAPAKPAQRPSQLPLAQLPALDLPADAKRAEKVALGHVLFFDQRLSANNDRSCYSCHQNEDGNGGHDPLAIGSGGKPLTRHAPVIWNVGYFKSSLYWDGRAASLEDNAKGAWGGGNMGVGKDNLDKKAAEIAAIPGYKKLFEAAGFTGDIKADQVAQALSEYERTLICKDTRYDKFAAGDKTAMNDQEQRGLDVFLGKGKCFMCHAPPFFTQAMGVDNVAFFNVGIGTSGVADDKVDVGRMKISNNTADWGAFKPPSLRNITKSAPYFHDGSVAKLDDAVKLMASGGIANKNKTPLLSDAGLSDAERGDLLAFLATLDCPGKLEQPASMP